MAAEVVLGLVAMLKADAGVMALPVVNVYDFELAVAADNDMPEKIIVVRPHAGPAGPATLELNYSRMQIISYGETPHLAQSTYWAAYNAMKTMQPSVWAHTYIHNCIQQSGPIPGRDPELQWPYNISVWLVKASDIAV